jgi:hypothetical protein
MFSKQKYPVNESSCSVKWKINGILPKNAKKYILKNNFKKVLKTTIFRDPWLAQEFSILQDNLTGKQKHPINESSCLVNRNIQLMKALVQ